MSENKSIRVLILEDRGTDVELMLHELRQAGWELDWQWVDSEKDFLAKLASPYDVVLADYRLPQFSALKALHLMQERNIATPLIIVSGAIGEDFAVSILREGAADFVHKDRLLLLPQVVQRVLSNRQLRESQRRSAELLQALEKRFGVMMEHSFEMVWLINERGRVLEASPSTAQILGFKRDDVVGHDAFERVHPEDQAQVRQRFTQITEHPRRSVHLRYRRWHGNGSWRWLESVETNRLAEPGVEAVIENAHDVTDEKEAQDQAEQCRQRLAALQSASGTKPGGKHPPHRTPKILGT